MEDYDSAKKDELRVAFASLANVSVSAVTLEVVSSSVRIHVTIAAADESEAADLEATVSPSLQTTSSASSVLGIPVEVVPLVQTTVTVQLLAAPPSQPPPMPPLQPPLPLVPPLALKYDKDSDNNAVIIGAAIGGVAGLALILSLGALHMRQRRKSKPKDVLVQSTQVQLSMESSSVSAIAAQPDEEVFHKEYTSSAPANSCGLPNVSHV